MRNLQKTLQLFASDAVMDYCPIFDEIKSVLEYKNNTVKPFNKLHFHSGNDAYIDDLIISLQQVLIKEGLVHHEKFTPLPGADVILRKVLMFLLANTDCTYKYNLRDDNSLTHVLEVCPLIPKFLLIALVWGLQLDIYFYEMLSYTPIWFGFQYVEVAVESLKRIDNPYTVLEKVEHLMRSILLSMMRSEYRQIDTIDQKIIYGKLDSYAMNLLRQFYTPDAEKFQHFTRNEFFRYSGFAMQHLLQMLIYAFELYEHPAEVIPSIDLEIYEICLSQCKKMTDRNKPSETLQEAQKKIITALLNSLQYNVMLVTIDVFIYWVEVDLADGKNLQQIIGELAYSVVQYITSNQTFQHDVQTQLNMIAIRPKTLQETVSDATNGEILRSLDQEFPTDVKQLWLNELFNRMDAFGNNECVETMCEHANLVSRKNCEQVLQFIKLENERIKKEAAETDELLEQIEIDADDNETIEPLRVLLRAAIQHFTAKEILQLLLYKREHFGEPSSICFTAGEDFHQRCTEFFNKLMLGFDVQQFLRLCFENATPVWSRFFESACQNEQHIKHFCQTVRETQPYSNQHLQRLLNTAMTDLTQGQMQFKYFPQLLCEIYFTLYHPGRKMDFLKSFINEHVNILLEAQAHESLLPIVKAMNLISTRGETQSYKPLHFEEVTAPVLVMVARIMDKSRWDLITYTDIRDELVRECIQFIQHNMKKFLPVATAKDRKWMGKVVKDSFRPLTQYYFQKFSLPPSQPPIHFDQFLLQKEIAEHSEAEMFLIIHYVRCTMKETEWLAQSTRLLPHISDVMLILGGVVNETNAQSAINNYRHCLINYANIVKKFLLPKVQDDNKQLEKLLMKILRIIAATPQAIYEETFISFECVLNVVCSEFKKPWQEEMIKMVHAYTATMQDCRGKVVFLKKFNELATGNDQS